MMFFFDNPIYLFLLLLIPLLVFIHFYSLSNRKKKALSFANFSSIARIQGVDFFSKNLIVLSLNILILLAIIFSLAGLNMQVTKQATEFSYVIALDSSNSMAAKDLTPDRFEASKRVIKQFIDDSPLGTKIGLISFSGNALIENELSKDKMILKNSVSDIAMSNYGGTDLYEAVVTSTNLLRGESYKSIIVVSDGQFNIGTIDEAIDYAKNNDIVVHSISIGTAEGGDTGIYISKVDEDALKSLAYGTGGEFYAALSGEDQEEAFGKIMKLTVARVSFSLSNYLLIFASILFVIVYFLLSTRYLDLI